ncbi:MAG: bifunctional tetrahydrofolate synthase/dihydrofolate synthase [Gammaproteobacteria bacterium]|nr:bifunctional tetrahydrofolate synthase/dihydrofolate synthase [Gammaproteobacteria bacterium]
MAAPRFATLGKWLSWQETLHHSKVDLGLERLASVARTLLDLPPDFAVITVAGTNGKGSVCAYLNAALLAAGFKTGMFTSPHLQRYNERIQIDGRPVSDDRLVEVFQRIDAARGDTTITYFEFSALAALLVFADAAVDCAILEVGMGGRLDAVNIVDADVALITGIGLDHQAWLGDNREQISFEKAGIMRPGRPAVCGDRDPPARLLEHAESIGAPLLLIGRDFDVCRHERGWAYRAGSLVLPDLPLPALHGTVQLDNAAVAIAGFQALGDRFPLAVGHIKKALESVQLPGRVQVLGDRPAWILDVSHNPESARVLSEWLANGACAGRTHLVLGMLGDKDAPGVAAALSGVVDDWYLCGLPGDRGMSAADLGERIAGHVVGMNVSLHASVREACEAAAKAAGENDRIVVCGSFHTVGEALSLGL